MYKKEKDSWGLVPKPFNPDYNPLAIVAHQNTVKSLIADNFYENHTREECKLEFKVRCGIMLSKLEER